jgi:hypothetical protein
MKMKKMKKQLLLVVLSIVLMVNLYGQNVPSYMPTNGLVGYWPFNGNANDASGNGNHGIVYGASLATDRNGNVLARSIDALDLVVDQNLSKPL